MSHSWKMKVSIAVCCAAAAMLISGYALRMVRSFHQPSFEAPHLPFVGVIPWITKTDFFSAPGQMGMAILAAAMVGFVAEGAKACLSQRRGIRLYLVALAFQAAVVWATFENGAPDWGAHFRYLVFAHGSKEIMADIGKSSPHWPWYSTLGLLLLAAAALGHFFHKNGMRSVEPLAVGLKFGFAGTRTGLAWLGAAWVVGALARAGIDVWFPPNSRWPHLGNVATMPWDPEGEPRSTTVRLFGSLVFGVLAMLLVEIVKVKQIRGGRCTSYWPLLAIQVVLFCDILATTAPDWASYALSSVFRSPVPMESLPSWPWISLLALVLLLLPDLGQRRAERLASVE